MRLIDADALIQKRNHAKAYAQDMYVIGQGYVMDAPTIDAVPVVRGEWKQGREFPTYPRVPFISTAYYCSNCEGEAYWDTDYGQQLFSFCPNCGADMRGSEVKASEP